MPSLFSRSSKQHIDEFGRIPSPQPPLPDGSFLPLNINSSHISSSHDYGYLAYQRHVVLGLEQVSRLVIVVSDELGTRGGITTPFIFSTTALDISSSAIKRLIQAFLATCTNQSGQAAADAETAWRDEARFAGPHELGMCLRWGLARAIRSVGGQDVRGLLSWDRYLEFRHSEIVQGYPAGHFGTLVQDLNPTLQTVLITLLTLLSRLTANSTSSGHTPPTLSPLFGPLIFGLGPATLAFHHTYTHYLRAVNAMEHLQLVFIRWQDATSTASLGVPVRLKEWIKGYPAMLPFLAASSNKPQPRPGVRTVRVMSVRRNVRMYSQDLVKTAASWAYRSDASSSSTTTKNALFSSKEWSRIAPPTLKLPPRYSDAYKKRMDMPPNFHPDTGSLNAPALHAASSSSSYGSSINTATTTTTTTDNDYFALGSTSDDRFRSLTDLKWGEFESMGFSALEDEKKLQFDLTESARTERSAKRESLNWTDFSSTGFSRNDAPLSATLQFSTPVAKTISAWPAHNAEIDKKLKKTEKALPPFGWDTEPVVVNEEIIEDAFVDVFCDLVYGSGWMDLERSEELERDCNWAIVEFKSLPVNRTTASGGSDPRTSTSLILFEEFVPLEYRQQLGNTPSTRRRRRLPSLFSSASSSSASLNSSAKKKNKGWKQAATLNGRPYVVGHVPQSPTYREVEFEEILRAGKGTKVISLGSRTSVKVPPPSRASIPPEVNLGGKPTISGPLYAPAPPVLVRENTPPLPLPLPLPLPHTKSDEESIKSKTPAPSVSSVKRPSSSRFRLPGGMIPVPSPGGIRKMKTGGGGARDEESGCSSFDFETRLAGWSDEEEGEGGREKGGEGGKDDAWVDILVGNQRRRLVGQEAEMKVKVGERERERERERDPDVASREVERVLAGVRDRTLSVASERVDRDPEGGLDHLHGDDGGEEVLRMSEESEYTNENENENESEQSPTTSRLLAKQQRRMGYFDLHPERRPQGVGDVSVEEPTRAFSDREEQDERRFGGLAGSAQMSLRKLPVPPAPVIKIEPCAPEPQKPAVHKQMASPGGNGNGNANAGAGANGHGNANVNAGANGHGNGNGNAQPATSVPMSKTAALIEMYRERERGATSSPAKPTSAIPASIPVAPLQLSPSRIPARLSPTKEGAALAAPAAAAHTHTHTPVPLAAPVPKVPAPAPAPALATQLVPGPGLVEPPPRIVVEETGRASPGRYVHGAPLHNVLEEEEEE